MLSQEIKKHHVMSFFPGKRPEISREPPAHAKCNRSGQIDKCRFLIGYEAAGTPRNVETITRFHFVASHIDEAVN